MSITSRDRAASASRITPQARRSRRNKATAPNAAAAATIPAPEMFISLIKPRLKAKVRPHQGDMPMDFATLAVASVPAPIANTFTTMRAQTIVAGENKPPPPASSG